MRNYLVKYEGRLRERISCYAPWLNTVLNDSVPGQTQRWVVRLVAAIMIEGFHIPYYNFEYDMAILHTHDKRLKVFELRRFNARITTTGIDLILSIGTEKLQNLNRTCYRNRDTITSGVNVSIIPAKAFIIYL